MNAKIPGPIARHGRLRSPGALGQLLKFLGLGLVVALVSSVSVAAVMLYEATNEFVDTAIELDGQQDLPPDIAAYEGGFNVLLIGVDGCEAKHQHLPGAASICSGHYSHGGTLNDVNILVHVSEEPRRVTAVSFPRDMIVPIPACLHPDGRQNYPMTGYPLNAAMYHGGLACVARTISNLTGQEIHFAASISFGGVLAVTEAIGGVEVCVESTMDDGAIHLAPGTHEISGLEALHFLRTRYGVGDGSDLGRIGNQQQYMSSLVRKVFSEGVLGDPPTLFRLARTVLNNVQPSQSLANPVLLGQLALVMKDVALDDIVFLQYPTRSGLPDYPGKVQPNEVAARQMWEAIATNAPLEITHTPGRNDGVVHKGSVEGFDDVVADDAVKLPSSVRGNTAATITCSNGQVYRY